MDRDDPADNRGQHLDKLSNANGVTIDSGRGSGGMDGLSSSSPSSSMMGVTVNGGNGAASNPAAKMSRNRSISKSFSTLELQFAAQQADKYDTLPLKIGKSFVAILCMLIITASFILAKTSVIYMATNAASGAARAMETYIVEMLCITILPLLTTAGGDLVYFWVRETKEKKIDPKSKRVRPHAILIIGMFEGIIEAVGISIFIMMVLPVKKVDPISKVLLLNGLCVIPIIGGLIMKWKKWLRPNKQAPIHEQGTDMNIDIEEGGSYKKKSAGADFCSRLVVTLVQVIFLALQLAGMGLYMYNTGLWWEIPVSLILSSMCWWKNYVFIDRLEPHWCDAFKRHRYASNFVKTVFKISFIFACVAVMARWQWDLSTKFIFTPSFWYDTIKSSHGMWYALLGSWVGYYIVWFACLACLQVFCVALPVLITTPLCVFYQTYSCKYYLYGDAAIGACDKFDIGSLDQGLWIAGGICLWISFIIVTAHLWSGIDRRDSNQLEEDMWAQPETFTPIFIEQSMALNRNRNPKVIKSLDGEVEYGYHAHRTFITTTMYHETKEEMQKLVMSLLQIDAEIPTEDKVADYYEAHIIFDDAFLKQPNTKPDNFDWSPYYNQYVFYLLEIFGELKLKKMGDPVVVWYGEVLTFKFALGMKLVIHLKDVTKIRQKKRWSQILYVHVILEDVLDNEGKLGMLDANTFILMIDGDTQFSRKSVNLMRHLIELDRVRSGAVCGRIFAEGDSNPVVWYQKFEYAVGHWFQKTAEHVFGSVLCSPGCFSLVRVAAIYRKSGEDMDGKMPAIESYSKEVETALDVLQFDQGEDRMLSTLIIQNGWRLQYCAGAEAGTFCPMSFGDFFKQRRRWVVSTLANLYFLISQSGEIVKTNASVSPPFMIYTAGVFGSSVFGPATVILIIIGGLGYAFNLRNQLANGLGVGVPLVYLAVLVVFNLDMENDTPRKKSKKVDIQIAAAFIICALYCLIMASVTVGIAAQIATSPSGVSAVYLYCLIGTMIIAAVLHGELFLLIYGVVYLFFLPTMYLTLIMYSVANTHDQSWGTRDGSSSSKETDADQFISVAKIGGYIREIKATFREALFDEEHEEEKMLMEEDKKAGRVPMLRRKKSRAKRGDDDDDGKEEIMMLEEERRRLEEEKKKAEEEKRKAEEERKLREIERQKEEAKKKKAEAEERERLQERLKQERRRGINHRYKDHLSALSRRLRHRVATPEKLNEKDAKEKKIEQIRELADLQKMVSFLFLLCTVIWLVLVLVVAIHENLQIAKNNSVGIIFLIAFGVITVLQFLAAIVHRIETLINALANVPMHFECDFIDEGQTARYRKIAALREAAENEPPPKERVAAKVARKILMVDKRTATKANLFG